MQRWTLRYNGRRPKRYSLMKKIRIAPLACLPLSLLLGPLLTSGCAVHENQSSCEAQMRQAVEQEYPHDELSVSHVGAGIGGSRVVVEGTIRGLAAAPVSASATSKTAPVAVTTHSNKMGEKTSEKASRKTDKKADKKTDQPAAAECLFKGKSLESVSWLRPPKLAAKNNATQTSAADGMASRN
jgi:hypothetical protein